MSNGQGGAVVQRLGEQGWPQGARRGAKWANDADSTNSELLAGGALPPWVISDGHRVFRAGLLVLAAFTGARRAQLLGLRWHNVDLATKRVSFSAGWVEGPDGPVLTATKTKRRHVVVLDPATVSVLVDLAADRC
jgi:hypothetical protein